MQIFLQLWGGLFYLFAKIFLAQEENKKYFNWKAIGWATYLIGIPPWAIILAQNHNWIAVAIEIGGAPAMIVGILTAVKKLKEIPILLDKVIKIIVGILITTGIIYSISEFGGITKISQVLELGVTIGYLTGTYLLSKRDRRGWLFFILMNLSMAILMLIQQKWIFVVLQTISIFFVIYGFIKSKNKNIIN